MQTRSSSLEIKCKIVRMEVADLWNFDYFSRSVVSSIDIYLLSSLLAIVSSYFKITKQAPGHNLENTVYLPEHYAFKTGRYIIGAPTFLVKNSLLER